MKFAWHVHHDTLLENLTYPIEERQQYIRERKPKKEAKLRLRLLRPVLGPVPEPAIKARERLLQKYMTSFDGAVPLSDFYDYAREVNTNEEILALHEKECPDCPWDGGTIFPAGHPWYEIALCAFAFVSCSIIGSIVTAIAWAAKDFSIIGASVVAMFAGVCFITCIASCVEALKLWKK